MMKRFRFPLGRASAQADSRPTLSAQRSSWEDWNAAAREHKVGPIPTRHAQVIESFISRLGRRDLNLIDVGCGTG